jgi:hypothetical protein
MRPAQFCRGQKIAGRALPSKPSPLAGFAGKRCPASGAASDYGCLYATSFEQSTGTPPVASLRYAGGVPRHLFATPLGRGLASRQTAGVSGPPAGHSPSTALRNTATVTA